MWLLQGRGMRVHRTHANHYTTDVLMQGREMRVHRTHVNHYTTDVVIVR